QRRRAKSTRIRPVLCDEAPEVAGVREAQDVGNEYHERLQPPELTGHIADLYHDGVDDDTGEDGKKPGHRQQQYHGPAMMGVTQRQPDKSERTDDIADQKIGAAMVTKKGAQVCPRSHEGLKIGRDAKKDRPTRQGTRAQVQLILEKEGCLLTRDGAQ